MTCSCCSTPLFKQLSGIVVREGHRMLMPTAPASNCCCQMQLHGDPARRVFFCCGVHTVASMLAALLITVACSDGSRCRLRTNKAVIVALACIKE